MRAVDSKLSGRRRALIVATDEYSDQRLRSLRSPAHDVQDLARVLGDSGAGGFDVEVVRNAPEHKLRRRIDAFFQSGQRDELLVLHLSCHGLKDDYGHLYFATVDTEYNSLDSTAVAADWLRRQIDRSRSGSIVVQLDCCYSGAFTSASRHRSATDVIDISGHLAGERPHGRGCVILTASKSTEYAFEGDHRSGRGEASVFTRAVVAGIESGAADLDGDGVISVNELYDFVFEKVRTETTRQTPGIWADVHGEIYMARSPRGPVNKDASPNLPADVLAAMASPRPAARAGAVADLAELSRRSNRQLAEAARSHLDDLAKDDSPIVSAAALAAQRGQRYTWVRATRATRIAFFTGALGVVLLLAANATSIYEGEPDTLSGTMFAYQTVGAALAAAAAVLAFLSDRTSAQFTTGVLLGVALASGVGATLALVDIGGNYIVARFGHFSDTVLFEGGNGVAQVYDAYLLWLSGAAAVLIAGLLLAMLAFGLRSPQPLRGTTAGSRGADVAVVLGAVAVIAGTLAAAETFVFERNNVRFGVGARHGGQALVIALVAITIVGARRFALSEFFSAIQGFVAGLAYIGCLYFVGIFFIRHSPTDASVGITIGFTGALTMLVGALLGAARWRRARSRVAQAM